MWGLVGREQQLSRAIVPAIHINAHYRPQQHPYLARAEVVRLLDLLGRGLDRHLQDVVVGRFLDHFDACAEGKGLSFPIKAPHNHI